MGPTRGTGGHPCPIPSPEVKHFPRRSAAVWRAPRLLLRRGGVASGPAFLTTAGNRLAGRAPSSLPFACFRQVESSAPPGLAAWPQLGSLLGCIPGGLALSCHFPFLEGAARPEMLLTVWPTGFPVHLTLLSCHPTLSTYPERLSFEPAIPFSLSPCNLWKCLSSGSVVWGLRCTRALEPAL